MTLRDQNKLLKQALTRLVKVVKHCFHDQKSHAYKAIKDAEQLLSEL